MMQVPPPLACPWTERAIPPLDKAPGSPVLRPPPGFIPPSPEGDFETALFARLLAHQERDQHLGLHNLQGNPFAETIEQPFPTTNVPTSGIIGPPGVVGLDLSHSDSTNTTFEQSPTISTDGDAVRPPPGFFAAATGSVLVGGWQQHNNNNVAKELAVPAPLALHPSSWIRPGSSYNRGSGIVSALEGRRASLQKFQSTGSHAHSSLILRLQTQLECTRVELRHERELVTELRDKVKLLEGEKTRLHRERNCYRERLAVLAFLHGTDEGHASCTDLSLDLVKVDNCGDEVTTSLRVPEFPNLCLCKPDIVENLFQAGKYKVGKRLGEGHFGTVWSARILRRASGEISNDEVFAIKQIHKSSLRSFDSVARLDMEVQALVENKGHPNIIPLVETFNGPKCFYIVLERGDMDLHEYLQLEGKRLGEEDARQIMLGVLRGVRHLHNNSYAHMDIKTSNILIKYSKRRGTNVTSGNIDANDIRLCDFSLCSHRPRNTGNDTDYAIYESGGMGVIGTICFFAPEIIIGGTCYDARLADVWSAGATLLCMTVGFEQPWVEAYELCEMPDAGAFGAFHMEIFQYLESVCANQKGMMDEQSKMFNPLLNILFRKMLVPPNCRLSAHELLADPYFKSA